MTPRTETRRKTWRRALFTAAIAAAVLPAAGSAVLATPTATGSTDPCAASEVARTFGTVAKSTGDYLDSHPETNQALSSMLQEPAGPQSAESLKSYFQANPKVALDLQGLANPLNKLGTQCKLPITLPQALGMLQAAQGGLPSGGTQPAPVAGTPPLPGPPPQQSRVH